MIKLKNILFFAFFFTGLFFGHSQNFWKKFKDSTDNALDLSYFIKDLHGVLPIIAPITEPAVGYGATVAGLYFISKDNPDLKKGYQKPDIAGVAGGYTENGTWFAGVGYLGFWKNDKIRYRGVVGYGDINLKYYRSLENINKEISAEFGLKSKFILQQVKFRLGDSDFFLGGKYTFGKTSVEFPKVLDFPEIDPLVLDFTNSGVSVIGEFENYKNVFSPNNGMRIHLDYLQNFEFLGSDRDWGKVTFSSVFYFPVNHFWVPAIRVESLLATGDAPFYVKPFVALRGVPAMRYQGDLTILLETEQAFNINSSRWDLVAFGGVGTAFRSIEEMKAGDLAWSAGGGFRYLMARLFGLKMGIDVARGPEDWAVYVVFGSAWLR
ncbi:MAG: hypothetical protein GQ552_09225 [Flavobacteriaceae bacterium]|nr:hypothetical protein [Flavobacteriaceae bacterium]